MNRAKQKNNMELPPVQPELMYNTTDHKSHFEILNTVSKKSGAFFQHFYVEKDCEIGFIPEGCINILFECEGDPNHAMILGIHMKRRTLQLKGDCQYFAVKLYSTFGLKNNFRGSGELIDQAIQFNTFISHTDLADRICDPGTFEERIHIFKECYGKWVDDNYFSGLAEECALLLCASGGNMSINHLESQTCYSKRYIQQQFSGHYGISPKLFGMIKRYQNAISQVAEQKQNFSYIAADSEYYDQSHFIKEFKRFTGYSPEQYRNLLFASSCSK